MRRAGFTVQSLSILAPLRHLARNAPRFETLISNPVLEIIHCAKSAAPSAAGKRLWRKHRQEIEPAIGHLKQDHRMELWWLQGALGDALHAVLCAAGYTTCAG
jgi:hypothetical protein